MTNRDSTLKSRNITLPTKVCLVKPMVFSVVMYGCESWTMKEAEHQRIDAFNCGVREDSWESLWQQGNQSILTEIDPEYSLERLMLKLQYFGYLMRRTYSLEKTLTLGKIECGRRREQQRMRWLDGITDMMDMSWWWTGKPGVLQSMGSQRVGHDWVTKFNWWTRPDWIIKFCAQGKLYLIFNFYYLQ